MPTPDEPRLLDAQLEVADLIGQLIEFWGFRRPMGRIWALLFLSPEPLGAAELAERLKMSAGAVSLALGELGRWGVVKRTWRPGERRDLYEAETAIWKLVRRVLRERELVLVREVRESLTKVQAALPQSRPAQVRGVGRSATDARAGDLDFERERIGKLLELTKVGETLLTALVTSDTVDTSPLRVLTGSDS